MFGKAFGAVAALKQESLALGDPGELALQLPASPAKTSGGYPLQALLDLGQPGAVRIDRHLLKRPAAPAFGCPNGHDRLSPGLLLSSRGGGLIHRVSQLGQIAQGCRMLSEILLA